MNLMLINTLLLVFVFCALSSNMDAQGVIDHEKTCNTKIEKCQLTETDSVYKPLSEYHFIFKTTVPQKYFREKIPLRQSSVVNNDTIILDIYLRIQPTCFTNQREVIYEYYYKDSLFAFEHTGILEDEKVLILKPPRYLLEESEYSFFFVYRFNKNKWTEYSIMANNNKRISPKKIVYNRFKYVIHSSDTMYMLNDDQLNCQGINVLSKHRGGIRKQSSLVFNSNIGFVYADVFFENDNWYSIELMDYDSNYCR